MTKQLPFGIAIDHETNKILLGLKDAEGKMISTALDVQDLADVITQLSQCQFALIRSAAGMQTDLPVDPSLAFEAPGGGFLNGMYEGLRRFALGIDGARTVVSVMFLSATGRLSDYRMSADMARRLGRALLEQIGDIPQGRNLQ